MKTNELFSASALTPTENGNFPVNSQTSGINKFPFIVNDMGKGVKILKCDFKSLTNQRISLTKEIGNKFVFLFNLQDKLQIFLNGNSHTLPRLQNLFHFNEVAGEMEFYFSKNTTYKFCILLFEKNYFKNTVQEVVEDGKNLLSQKKICYKGFPNLKISDQVYKLMECKKQFPACLIGMGYVNIIIGLLLNQYMDHKNGVNKNKSSLREWEIFELQNLTEIIKKNPEQNYTINRLAKQSGLSIPKMQEGFKEIHGHTVSNFIREVRLQKAEELLKHSDLNISEIVYTVGLCSRSYFSRIFKKRYKCTPTDYQRQQFSLAVTA